MTDKIVVFDTSLRDGEQTAGVCYSAQDKVDVAAALAALNFIKWRLVLGRIAGSVLLWLWGAVMFTTLGTALSVEELAQATLGLYLALIVFVAVIGKTRALMVVVFVSISSYLLIPVLLGHDRTVASLAVPAVAVGSRRLRQR